MAAKQSKYAFYSVRNPVKLDGLRRVPSVCYPIPSQKAEEMEKLAAEGLVVLYEQEVRFISGAPYPVAGAEPVVVQAPATEPAASKRKVRSSSASGDGEFSKES